MKTKDLENTIINSSENDFRKVYKEIQNTEFGEYIKVIAINNDIELKEIFNNSDISSSFGYKILSGERKTSQRDIILCICINAGLNFEQIQTGLKLYGMAPLYAKNKRDALIIRAMSIYGNKIIDINSYLASNNNQALCN